jgi:hypothetical protein
MTLDQVQVHAGMMRPITAAADEWRQIGEDRRREIESLREDHQLELQALREENRQLREELAQATVRTVIVFAKVVVSCRDHRFYEIWVQILNFGCGS